MDKDVLYSLIKNSLSKKKSSYIDYLNKMSKKFKSSGEEDLYEGIQEILDDYFEV